MTQSDKKEEKNKETQKAEPTSEKEKKLNRKVADKLKFYGVVTVLSLLCAGFIWFIFKPDTPETVEGMAGINTTIPDAIAPETMADKQKAYELEEMKKRRQEKVRTLQDMAGGYLMPDTTDGLSRKKMYRKRMLSGSPEKNSGRFQDRSPRSIRNRRRVRGWTNWNGR